MKTPILPFEPEPPNGAQPLPPWRIARAIIGRRVFGIVLLEHHLDGTATWYFTPPRHNSIALASHVGLVDLIQRVRARFGCAAPESTGDRSAEVARLLDARRQWPHPGSGDELFDYVASCYEWFGVGTPVGPSSGMSGLRWALNGRVRSLLSAVRRADSSRAKAAEEEILLCPRTLPVHNFTTWVGRGLWGWLDDELCAIGERKPWVQSDNKPPTHQP